jgi:TatD DNase family protein
MFDTHCHLNFSVFKDNLDKVIQNAKQAGVNYFVIPGTDYESSKRAVKIAEKYDGAYAAVGIHPHHVYQYQRSKIKDQNHISNIKNDLKQIERLLTNPKIVAVGEVGIDRYYYQKTKYVQYKIDEEFIQLQKECLRLQIQLAAKYKKSLILHNRKAKKDLLDVLTNNYKLITNNYLVFHCCEPDQELLDFVIEHNIFIGVDGDVTYSKDKQEFIKKVPLELLVLETDSPFLKPRGTKFPNEPKNILIIAEHIAKVMNVSTNRLIDTTTENARKLFSLDK